VSIKCLSPPFLSPETFRKLRRIHLRNAYNTVMNERGLPEATHAEEADANRAYDPQIERRYGEPDPKTLKAAEAAAMAAEASLNEDDMGYVSPAPPATSPPPILDKGQMAFWGGHYADYREETPHAPDGSPMTRNTAKGIAPYHQRQQRRSRRPAWCVLSSPCPRCKRRVRRLRWGRHLHPLPRQPGAPQRWQRLE
jgi:hypothetical protein